jgi:hypothetical protein
LILQEDVQSFFQLIGTFQQFCVTRFECSVAKFGNLCPANMNRVGQSRIGIRAGSWSLRRPLSLLAMRILCGITFLDGLLRSSFVSRLKESRVAEDILDHNALFGVQLQRLARNQTGGNDGVQVRVFGSLGGNDFGANSVGFGKSTHALATLCRLASTSSSRRLRRFFCRYRCSTPGYADRSVSSPAMSLLLNALVDSCLDAFLGYLWGGRRTI